MKPIDALKQIRDLANAAIAEAANAAGGSSGHQPSAEIVAAQRKGLEYLSRLRALGVPENAAVEFNGAERSLRAGKLADAASGISNVQDLCEDVDAPDFKGLLSEAWREAFGSYSAFGGGIVGEVDVQIDMTGTVGGGK